jgi:hypothetical protein
VAAEMKTIRPPKPFWNLNLQIIGFLIPTLLAAITLKSGYILTIGMFLFFGFWFLITFLLLYVPRNESQIRVAQEENLLEIIKKDKLLRKYDLKDITGFFTKYTWGGGRSFTLSVKKSDDTHDMLFALEGLQGALFSKKQWDRFSEELARLSGKEYKKEVWIANFNGDLELKTPEESRTIKKTMFLYPLLMIFPLGGAILFHRNPTADAFIGYGIAASLLNGFSYSFFLKRLACVQHGEQSKPFRGGMLFLNMIQSFGLYVLSILIVKMNS